MWLALKEVEKEFGYLVAWWVRAVLGVVAGLCFLFYSKVCNLRYNVSRHGEVPEWTNGAVSKTAVVFVATVGSNPTLSAMRKGSLQAAFFACVGYASSVRVKLQSSKIYSRAMVWLHRPRNWKKSQSQCH